MLRQKKSFQAVLLGLLALPTWASGDELQPYPGAGFLPDMAIERFEFQLNSLSGDLVSNLQVSNRGSVATGRNPVFIQFRTGPDFSTATILQQSQALVLQPGEIRTVSTIFSKADIDQHVFAVIDPDNYIEEVNEDNNVAMATPAAEVEVEPEIGGGSGSANDVESVLLPDDGRSEFNVGEMPRFVVSVSTEEYARETLSAVFSVVHSSGETVYTSANLPLLFDDLNGAWQTEIFWQTLGLPAGGYTLVVSIVSEESGEIDQVQQQVTLIESGANRAPVALPDSAETYVDEPVEISLLVNDYEPDGDRFEHYISEQPEHGQVSELRGVAWYQPAIGFVGVDRFAYQMDDTLGGSDWAEVTVKVLPDKNGCTWVRDFSTTSDVGNIAEDGWADFNLPEEGNGEYASKVSSNDNPDLFEEQPFISFPSCSLYFKPKAGQTGSATVTYVVLDKATNGQTYVSEPRYFTIEVKPAGDEPQILSVPDTLVEAGDVYRYTPELSSDVSSLTAIVLPDFLSLEDGTLSGTPQESDIGMHEVWLVAETDDGQAARQSYWLTVTPQLTAAESEVLADDPQPTENAIVTGGGAGSPWLLLIGLLALLRGRGGRS